LTSHLSDAICDCGKNGVCHKGECVCINGYTGDQCDTLGTAHLELSCHITDTFTAEPYTALVPGELYTGSLNNSEWIRFYFELPALHFFMFEEVAPNLVFYYQADLPIRDSNPSSDFRLTPFQMVCPQPRNRTIYLAAQCSSSSCPYTLRVDIGE
jgi:hypothetical protein